MFVLFAMLNQGGWTVNNHRNVISVITVYNELRYILLCSNTAHALDISLEWSEGVCLPTICSKPICRDVVTKSGNSTVCYHYSENTKLSRKVA